MNLISSFLLSIKGLIQHLIAELKHGWEGILKTETGGNIERISSLGIDVSGVNAHTGAPG